MKNKIKNITYFTLILAAFSPMVVLGDGIYGGAGLFEGGGTGLYLDAGPNGVGGGASVLGIGAGAGVGVDPQPEETSSYYYTIPE